MNILNVNIPGNSYDIVIEKGLFKNFGSEIKEVYHKTNIVVITDLNVFNLYGNALNEILEIEGFNINFIVVQPGEASKSLIQLEHIYSELTLHGITRSDLIVAFGGGVVGDLAGFAASTFMRGIQYIQIPTTLLSQIDSSVGGKVAINLKEGKNLAGNFYHPLKVLIDPEMLLSLPEKNFKDGLGEVIKYACIKDPILFHLLMNFDKKQLYDYIEQLIYTCCNIKKIIVEQDEKDMAERMLLNFGHTLGHAIERHMNFEITHGEAVSLGMLYITKNSEELGLTETGTYDKLKNMLIHFSIDYNLCNLDIHNLKKYIYHDKKNLSGEISLILLNKIGEAFIHKISFDDIDKFISI